MYGIGGADCLGRNLKGRREWAEEERHTHTLTYSRAYTHTPHPPPPKQSAVDDEVQKREADMTVVCSIVSSYVQQSL